MRWQFDDTGIDLNGLSEHYGIAPLGKEGFYRKLGFLPMRTAMASFQNQENAIRGGLVEAP